MTLERDAKSSQFTFAIEDGDIAVLPAPLGLSEFIGDDIDDAKEIIRAIFAFSRHR